MPILDKIYETQLWKSVFRHPMPTDRRNRVVVMLTNFFLHLHPVSVRKQGIAAGVTPGAWAARHSSCSSWKS